MGLKSGVALESRQGSKTRKPRLYKVFLVNDDFTAMHFVVHVLESVFGKSPLEATRIMLHVHRSGRGLAGVYTRDIAETKIAAVHRLAQEHEFPLKSIMERE
jgi:ATP-dependent Clp protease adaptor protein ClpS